MLSPYKKLAKLSLKRARLSCMSWKCIRFASRSATPSDSSEKAGSRALSGKAGSWARLARVESWYDEREEGLNGVVGRDVRVRELDPFALGSHVSPAMVSCGLRVGPVGVCRLSTKLLV